MTRAANTSSQNHKIIAPEAWMNSKIDLWVAGVGGTGSHICDALCSIHHTLNVLGHPGGLRVTLFDPDHVTEPNLGRARFLPSDLGLNKAHVLGQRMSLFHGVECRCVTHPFEAKQADRLPQILVSCVDSASARSEIWSAGRNLSDGKDSMHLWLDCGNDRFSGQVLAGDLAQNVRDRLRIPNAVDLYAEIKQQPDDDEPSCSTEEALFRQDLFVNRYMAQAAGAFLWQLIRYGHVDYHGVFIDLRNARSTPLRVCPEEWSAWGYKDRQAA